MKSLIVDRIRVRKADTTELILDKFEQKPEICKDLLTDELNEGPELKCVKNLPQPGSQKKRPEPDLHQFYPCE